MRCERCEQHDPRDRRDHGHIPWWPPSGLIEDQVEASRADEAGLVAKYRIPLTESRANSLRDVLIEHPEHELHHEPPFLVVREVLS